MKLFTTRPQIVEVKFEHFNAVIPCNCHCR